MFDLARLTEAVGGLLGQAATALNAEALLQQVGEQGLDLQALQNLDAESFLSVLGENGIDLSQIDAGQIAELAQQLGLEAPASELLQQFLDRAGQ